MTTALQTAFDRYAVAPDHPSRRVAFLGAFLRAEVHLALDGEGEGDNVTPILRDVDGQAAVVVFDGLEDFANFAGGQADQATLSGRVLVEMLAGQNLGCVINPDGRTWSYVLDAATLDWMAEHLVFQPEMATPSLDALEPASLADLNVVEALDATLPACRDRADHAILAQTQNEGASQLVLFFIDAVPDAEGALSQIVQDMVTFAGVDMPATSVAFAQSGTVLHDRLGKIGLRLDIPQSPQAQTLTAPGSDPEKPPILR